MTDISTEQASPTEKQERARVATSIDALLRPQSVAVIGASRNPMSIGRRILDALVGAHYRGPIYPVNREAGTLAGLPAFASVRAVPGPVDLAVIAVPRESVLGVVDDCAAVGVKALVVITAGFAESDEQGRALQAQLVEKVRRFGMRMVGPNCMGVLNASDEAPLNASFSPIFPPAGRLALSSQSGALGIVILDLAARRHVGLSSFVSVGNKADVSSNDLLQYWEQDGSTSVIALYLESFGNPRTFARLARRIGRTKPIIAVKAGRTRAGSRAAGSHTAALAASETAVAALFHQTGVIRADTIDEMFDLAACLDVQPLPAGHRVVIVTNAGGPGILAADACDAVGLSVVELSAATRARLTAFLPAVAQVGNPVDMIASAGPDEYRQTVEAVLAADETDALIILYTPVDSTHSTAIVTAIAEGVARGRAAGARLKPVLACLMPEGAGGPLEAGGERIPVYAFPENAVRALGKIATYAAWRAAPPGAMLAFDDVDVATARAICRHAVESRGDDWLTPDETRRVLEAYRVPLEPSILARSAAEARSIARTMRFPVVAKISAAAVVHKSDMDGVRLNLATEDAVSAAFESIVGSARARGIEPDGVVIQPQSIGGVETMIGMVNDRLFGPIVGFGLGGTEVEVLGDIHFRVTPMTEFDLDELVHETRAARLLAGFRGRPPADVAALRDIVARVSALADGTPEILELDLNPVLVLAVGQGCRVVDARIRVGHGKTPHPA